MTNTPPRSLTQIADDIRSRTESIADVVEIGRLLVEAQNQVGHGEWLPWLESEFDFSARTAQNYMAAQEFALKYETVAHLRLTCSALYALASGGYGDAEVDAVLAAAAVGRVTRTRLGEIVDALEQPEEAESASDGEPSSLPPWGKTLAAAIEAEAAEAAEVESILDGPPPELPPTEDAPAVDHLTPAFKAAVEKLCELRTKPIAKFKELAATPEALAAAEFLQDVVSAGGNHCGRVAEGDDATVEAFCMEWARSEVKQIFETGDQAQRAAMVAFICRH